MSGLVFYVIDTETTGLSSSYHEMTEIGIVRYTDRVQLWRQIKCEYPERASLDALNITKKTLADLEKGHHHNDVVNECERLFAEDGATPAHRVIVAHNAAFDRRFLHALWKKNNKQFPANVWLDTIAMTKKYIENIDHSTIPIIKTATGKISTQLHACCDMVGIKKLSEAHNAKVDSKNTYLLLRNLLEDKKIDYIRMLKTEVHILKSTVSDDECGLDPALLDNE